MGAERFIQLAEELAARDSDLGAGLDAARRAAQRLRAVAADAVEAFCRAAREHAAHHLTDLEVGPVEADEKHVDALQIRISRGRWEALVVVRAEGAVTLVGPFRRGHAEKPCSDQELRGPRVEVALEDLVAELIRSASAR